MNLSNEIPADYIEVQCTVTGNFAVTCVEIRNTIMDKITEAAREVSMAYIDYLYFNSTIKCIFLTIFLLGVVAGAAYIVKKASE